MKLFSKIATALVGMAMAVGVGVAVSGNNSKEVRAESLAATFDLSSSVPSGLTASTSLNADSTRGMGKGGTSFTLTTTSSFTSVTKIVVNAATNYGTYANHSISATVGGSAFGSAQNFSAKASTDYTITGSASTGTVVVSLNNSAEGTTKSNTIWVKTISVYTSGEPAVTYTITYDSNGGSGTMEDTTNTVAACTFTAPEGKTFSTWNTAANGSGTDYAPGATATSDLDLFAIWIDTPSTVEYVAGVDVGQSSAQGTGSVITKSGVTMTTTSSRDTDAPYRFYASSTVTFSSSGNNIVGVDFRMNGTYSPSLFSADVGTYDSGTGSWTGDVSEVVFTVSAQARCDSILVTLNNDDPSLKTMRIQDNYHHVGPFEVTYGDTSEYKYALAWDVDGDTALRSGCSWTISDESIIDFYTDGDTWLCYKPKNVGTTTITVSHADYNTVSTTITVVPGTVTTVAVSGSMTKTSYYVGEAWSNAGLVATATYDSGYVATVTDDATWTWNPAAPATSVVSVTPTATYESVSGVGSAQAVTVSRTNPIQVLYTQSSGASVDVYGYYVGFLDGTGPVIMDGEYGIVVYNKSADVSGYTEGVTILHVTGSISIYKGLYEVGSATISVASGTYDVPSTPVVYATNGNETYEYASRLTTVTGTATVTSGSFDDAAGTNDIKMSFTVGTKSVQVFYKKAAQTADADAFAAMKQAVTDSTEITIKGFTGWYDGFQVQMNGYIPPAEDYTAEDFSQDLLDQTDAVCEDYDDVTNNHDAIEAIWSNLASNDKYPSLPADQKTILAEAARDESGTVVEQAMARYDYLTGKYNLSNFINGRTPVAFAAPSTISSDNNLNSTMSIVVVAVIAITSLSAIGVLLVIKRRKSI